MGMTVDDILAHHGIKGMHWGVRRAQKKAAIAERNHFRNLDPETLRKVYNTAVGNYNSQERKRINNRAEYKGKDLTKDPALRLKYQAAHASAFAGALDKSLAKHSGQVSPGGNYVAHFMVDSNTMTPYLHVYRKKTVSHADGNVPEMRLPVKFDSLGHIVELLLPKNWMQQSDISVDDILAHHGIKGMKWGVRKARAQRTAKRKVKRFKANQKIKSKRQDISSRRRQLSEGDLKKVIDRLQTEKKLKDLVDADIRPGRTITKRILSESGQKVARTVIAGGGLVVVKAAIDKKMGRESTSTETIGLLSDHIKNKLKKGK